MNKRTMIFCAWHAICDVHLFVVFYLSSFCCTLGFAFLFVFFFFYSWCCFFICLFFLVLLGCCAATIPLVFILQPNTKKRRCSFTILFCIICFLPVFHRSKTVTNIQPLGYILQPTKIKNMLHQHFSNSFSLLLGAIVLIGMKYEL